MQLDVKFNVQVTVYQNCNLQVIVVVVLKMSKSSKRSKPSRKMDILLFIWFNIRYLLDVIIDSIFSWLYKDKTVKIPPVTKDFLTQSAVSIAKKIRTRELTSEEVVLSFIERCNQVQPIINAITDKRFAQAIEEAKQVDNDINSGNITQETFDKKPFLGVPFSTKESTSCKGLRYTFGMISRKEIRAKEDADVIKAMKEAGAILICNTNIPEFNLWQESRNNIYGMTLNPYDTTRTTGGSSGGEAALLASCGTAFGIGTDIGGSIRMPAFFCGVYGHKPTSYLISTKGLTKRTGTEKHTMVVPGPMTRFAGDLTPLLKVMLGKNVSKLRLDTTVDIQKLKYYYVEDALDIRSSSVCTELRNVIKKVANHFIDELSDDTNESVIQLTNIEELSHSSKLWKYWMTQEPVKFAVEIGNGTPINVYVELLKTLIGKSDFTFAVIMRLLEDVIMPKENGDWAKKITDSLRTKLLEKLNKNGVLLYPSYSWPASYHYTAFFRPYNFSCCSIFNVLQFPVTQVPMGLSKDGLPLGLQIVAAPYNDHLCIAVAKHLENNFGGYVTPF